MASLTNTNKVPLIKQTSLRSIDDNNDAQLEPMEPYSQCINTSVLSLTIVAIACSEVPFDEKKITDIVRDDLLRVNPCFSSIVVRDKMGRQWWKRVEVRMEDHIVIPSFQPGLTPEEYTNHFDEYLAKINHDELSMDKPLWELHLFKYPTREGQGTLVFKMHHALGDGFSIMGAVFSCLKRADDPSLPLTFPCASASNARQQSDERNVLGKVVRFIDGGWNSVTGFLMSFLRSTVLEDDRTVIRSRKPRVEDLPCDIASVTFSMDDIKRVKSNLNVLAGNLKSTSKTTITVNDIVVGTIFYGTELYTKALNPSSNHLRRTALVLLNTRMLKGYRNLEEMLEKDLWGNSFSFIHLPLPSIRADKERIDPLKFIFRAHRTIKRSKNSLGTHLNGSLLQLVGRLKGIEVCHLFVLTTSLLIFMTLKNMKNSDMFQAMSRYIYSTLENTSMAISNMVGPTEKMNIAGHPINDLYFTVTGSPQSLLFTVLSYMGKLRIVVKSERGFIDSQNFTSCLKEAFKKICEAADKADK
ncbi:hypothetical protein Syun_003906 [Stephania yunnanensis]|uniref:Diacylglycerol O-acyltransferase n=1 Tax=Stephania yunnanensis TaxID=152371 RepID=A0AAP0L5Z8_9MAGN